MPTQTPLNSFSFRHLNLDFSTAQYRAAPYPCFVFNRLFSEETIRRLKEEFPAPLLSERAVVAGGRHQLSNTSQDFYAFLGRSSSWRKVYEEFNSQAFMDAVLAAFGSEIPRSQPLFEIEKLKFDPTLFERQSSLRSVARYQALSQKKLLVTGSKDICEFLVVREYLQWKSKYEKLLNAHQCDVALSFDLSIAHDGYSREVHRDSDGRIAAMVVYLDDFSAGEGGNFVIHRHRANKSLEDYEPQPRPDDALPIVEFRPKTNFGLLFLNVSNAYHSVPVIRNSQVPRKFFYLGLTLVGKKAWKNRFRFDYNRYLV